MPETVLIPAATARRFGTDVLVHGSLSQNHAQIVADALVLADLRGVDTHGLNRLPGYLARIRSGALNPSPELRFEQRSPVCALLDAQHTFGFLAAHAAVERALEMAATFGVGIVAVKNSGHYGMAATYLLQAIEATERWRSPMLRAVCPPGDRASRCWGPVRLLWACRGVPRVILFSICRRRLLRGYVCR